MAKTDTQKQGDYRERKKLESDKSLKKREKDTKRIMSKHSSLPKSNHRDADSLLRNQQSHHDDRKTLVEQIQSDSGI